MQKPDWSTLCLYSGILWVGFGERAHHATNPTWGFVFGLLALLTGFIAAYSFVRSTWS